MVCYDLLLQVPFCEDESAQLFRVAFCRSDFLQNPYFNARFSVVFPPKFSKKCYFKKEKKNQHFFHFFLNNFQTNFF